MAGASGVVPGPAGYGESKTRDLYAPCRPGDDRVRRGGLHAAAARLGADADLCSGWSVLAVHPDRAWQPGPADPRRSWPWSRIVPGRAKTAIGARFRPLLAVALLLCFARPTLAFAQADSSCAAAPPVTIPLIDKAGFLALPAKIDSEPLSLLLDTGADAGLVTPQVAQ